MKEVKKVNDNLDIEIQTGFKRTVISVNKDNEKIILSDLETDEFFWANVTHDDNYIVVYSGGCFLNQKGIQVEKAYNIESNTVVEVENNPKLAENLKYMLVDRLPFDTSTVLSVINKKNIGHTTEEEITDLINYLTSENPQITLDEVIEYIVDTFPVLENYQNMEDTITIEDYKDVTKKVGCSKLFFYKMPQIIDDSLTKENENHKALRR